MKGETDNYLISQKFMVLCKVNRLDRIELAMAGQFGIHLGRK